MDILDDLNKSKNDTKTYSYISFGLGIIQLALLNGNYMIEVLFVFHVVEVILIWNENNKLTLKFELNI